MKCRDISRKMCTKGNQPQGDNELIVNSDLESMMLSGGKRVFCLVFRNSWVSPIVRYSLEL